MENIKISVIVPVYKTEKYIRQCVDSIINQTYKNLEIILVDDGSPDNCGQICDEYAEKDSRVHVIHKSNGGLVSARKEGVNIATGDYITFVDSDDWIDSGTYFHAAEIIESYRVDVCVFGFKRIYENCLNCEHENLAEGFYDCNLFYKEICKIDSDEIFYKKIVSPVCWNKVIKANIVKNNIANVDDSIKIGEDAALIYPSLLDSDSYYITHSAYYNYRKNNNSIMNSFDNERYKSVAKVLSTVYDAVKKHHLHIHRDAVIMNQFKLYSFDLMLITDTSHYINNIRELYPEIKDNDRILLYGKGVFAHNLKCLIEKDNSLRIAGFIDSSSINEIDRFQFSYIIIAVTISSFIEDILGTLKEKNISSEKILYLKNKDIERICKRINIKQLM